MSEGSSNGSDDLFGGAMEAPPAPVVDTDAHQGLTPANAELMGLWRRNLGFKDLSLESDCKCCLFLVLLPFFFFFFSFFFFFFAFDLTF
jgi:hypothetical protein